MRRSPLMAGVAFAVATGVTLAVLMPGWTADGDVGPPSAALIAATQAPPVTLDAAAAPGAISSDEPVVDAAALRLLLEQLLGEHVLVLAGASADAADGGSLADALAAVQPNTDDLGDAIGLVYGPAGQQAFTSLWTQHIAFFIDRAAAAGHSDRAAVAQADGHLHHYEQDFGTFTQTATAGELPAEVVTDLLEGHVSDTNAFVAAHLAADGEGAATEIATGHARVADIGAGLAAAIGTQAPAAFPGPTSTEDIDAASAVGRALAAYLGATSIDLDTAGVDADLRAEVIDSLAEVSADQERTRDAAAAWLDADAPQVSTTAEALADSLSPQDPEAVTDALISYARGRDAPLLDPRTKTAHDAAYAVAGAMLGR